MITITNVSKTYSKSNVKAVDNLSLEIKSGEIFGFLGPNGAGKSTTIKMLTGIITNDDGSIEIDGINVKNHPVEAKRIIGYVSDNHETYDTLKGIEYLNFVGAIFGLDKDVLKQRIDKYATMFQLTDALGDYVSSYSHGMKQKLSIISALIHEPKVWILDEPLTGLDPQSAYELKKLMREYADKGNTVFFSSHVIDVVEKVCDRIAIINHGKLVVVDTLENVKANKDLSLEDIFLTITAKDVTSGENAEKSPRVDK